MNNSLEGLAREFNSLRSENAILHETVNDLASRATDAFWQPINSLNSLVGEDTGIGLQELKELSQMLRDRVAAGSLHKRAVELTHAYVFGEGLTIEGTEPLQPRIIEALKHPYNQAALFSQTAQQELTAAMYTDGQVMVMRDTRTRVLTRLPLAQVGAVHVDDDSPERIWHVKRSWTANGKSREAWYATASYARAVPKAQRIRYIDDNGKRVEVDDTRIVHITSASRQVGWSLGLPVGLPAVQWIETYSKFIQNSASLVESYSKIAFKYSQKSSQLSASAVTIGGTPDRVGGVAGMGLDDSLTAMPAMGSQVSFSNGRPIASLAASAIGISVVALLSDPGAAGSSYGAAQTLDSPTVRVMSVWQDKWVAFFREILEDMGAKPESLQIEFPSIETDVPYRQLTSLASAFQTGALHRGEYRGAVLNLLNIPGQRPVEDLPEPDQFNAAHPIAPETEADSNADDDSDGQPTDPLPRQGNTGAVGSMNFEPNANRDADAGRE